MTNKLLNGLKQEYNWTRTENDALTHKSTLNDVLDYYYHAPAKRGQDTTQLFTNAFNDNQLLAVKAAFYVRDIRGGQGERETFKQALRWLYKNEYKTFVRIIGLVPEYGTWKDILEFVNDPIVQSLVGMQLLKDRESITPSLLAKWMPSENTSSKDTQTLAAKWIHALDLTPRQYRKVLVSIRTRLEIVESFMSDRKFDKINYEHVPSIAMLRLRKAFSRQDADRFVAYLESVKKGEKKINAATLYPYELVASYVNAHDGYGDNDIDDTVELQWKALPNYADSDENALAVVDVSGSMFQQNNMPINVSVSIGIYLAERNHGAFKNNFITFSATPQLITLRNGTLKSKVNQVFAAGVGYNTNIQAVFDMLLNVSIRNKVAQEDMPTKIFVISDMEFDHPNVGGRNTNFDIIKRKYRNAGYEMPILVFWNVASRNLQTPVTQNENGVFLVSGASPSIFKSALNTKAVTPLDLMLEVLNGERYAAVENALLS